MTLNNGESTGTVFLTDLNGRVIEIVFNNLFQKPDLLTGRMITSLVISENFEKMLNFMARVRIENAGLSVEINSCVEDEIVALVFTGIRMDEKILIIASRSSAAIVEFCEKLMQINNEQLNFVRGVIKEKIIGGKSESSGSDIFFYDELTRLNNELANAQREVIKKNIELEELNDQKNQLIGMAAHDLRNPLSVIKGYSEFLLTDDAAGLNEEQVEIIKIVSEASNRMLDMVNNLLDISKIESGKVELNLKKENMTALIASLVKVNKIIAAKKGINIIFNHSDEEISVNIDTHKITQVLDNLLSNAIKFSFPGSSIEVSVTLNDLLVKVCVKDYGQGIPAGEIHKLFKPFSRTSVKSTAGESNSGLGLAIVKKIIQSHKGDIFVESEFKKGASFYFTLPVCT